MTALVACGVFNFAVGVFAYHHYGTFRQRWALMFALLNFFCAAVSGVTVVATVAA